MCNPRPELELSAPTRSLNPLSLSYRAERLAEVEDRRHVDSVAISAAPCDGARPAHDAADKEPPSPVMKLMKDTAVTRRCLILSMHSLCKPWLAKDNPRGDIINQRRPA